MTDALWELITQGVVTGVFASLIAFITVSVQIKKAPADITAQYQAVASKQAQDNIELEKRLEEKIAKLQAKIDELEKAIASRDRAMAARDRTIDARDRQIEEMRAGIFKLIAQLEKLDIIPDWRPRKVNGKDTTPFEAQP